MRIINQAEIDGANAASNITSDGFDASSVYNMSAQVISGATQLGTFKLQYSNDPVQSLSFVTHWSDITGKTVAVSGAGTGSIEKFDVCYQWIRAVYTATSGTGVLSCNIKTNGY